MFGGLELKGSGDDENNGKSGPAGAVSAFGFLNNSDSPSNTAMDAPAPASSGFSFLNANPAGEAPAASASEPTAAALSGFSFMQETPAAPPEAAPVETTTQVQESGFSFMIPSPDRQPETNFEDVSAAPPEDSAEAPVTSSSPTVAPSSAFSFLSSGSTTLSTDEAHSAMPPAPAPAAPPATVSVGSEKFSDVSAPSPVNTPANVLELPSAAPSTSTPAGPPGLLTGAGVTFGTASTKKAGVRKKKTRAQKVGMGAAVTGGAAATGSSPSPPQAAPSPSPAPAPFPKEQPPSMNETRDGAAEAQRRAEEFMTRKTLAEATTTPSTVPSDTSAPKMTIPTYDEEPPLRPSASTDEEVARARRAAEEAQKMAAAAGNGKEGRGGFMGTFFKGFGSSSSSLNAKTNNSVHSKRASPTPSASSVDKVSKQQQEMKRAAAERQMQYQQQPKVEENNDDEEVVVSTSAGGYQPEVDPTPSPEGITVKTTTKTTTFEPIAPVAPVSKNQFTVKEMAPTPKKKKTATQVFEEYQALFAQSVHRAIQQVESVRSQQKMLSEERFVAIAKERLAIQQIQQTEAQLQVAVDNEDYELADHLGQVIEGHNREKAEVASVLDSIAKGLEQLESQKGLVVQGVATCFDNLAVHIKELQEQENAKDRDSDSGTLKQFATISKQLSAEQERLNQDLKHLERDEKLVAEERSELESAISEQSGEYERQRDDVKEKLSTVEEEITELRRQLEEKSKTAAGLRTEMYGLEDNISKVRVKFSRQLTRVEKKERSIQENRSEWETEKVTFQKQKEAHELQVQSHSEALLAHDALMKTLGDELKTCKEFAGMVSTKLGFMPTDSKSKEAEDAETEGNLAQLQADVVKCEAACSEAKVLLKAAAATVWNLEAEHATLTARVPQLEAEKKAAAAKRDFKAASKASKEIKEASARLKECEEELHGEAAEKKKAAEQELDRLTAELDEARAIANEEEKVSGLARMKDLADQIKNLMATKEELCGDVSADQNTVKGVGAFVLEGQVKALKDEGEDLGSKYGGWNELIKDILCEEGQATEEPQPESAEAEAPAPAPAPVDDGLTSEERIAKVRGLVKRIQEAEEALEAAAEREDYEDAARLQEVFGNLQSELENTNLTDEESELAFADDVTVPAVERTENAETPAEYDETENAEIPAEADETENDEGENEAMSDDGPGASDTMGSTQEAPESSEDPANAPVASEDQSNVPEASGDQDAPLTPERGEESHEMAKEDIAAEEVPQDDEESPVEAPTENGSATGDDTVGGVKETKEGEQVGAPYMKEAAAPETADDPIETE